MSRLVLVLLALSLCSCRSSLTPATPLWATPNDAFRKEAPLPLAPTKITIPRIQRDALETGFGVHVIERPLAQFVSLRFVSRRGGRDGSASVAGEATLIGEAIARRPKLEQLDADVEIAADAFSVSIDLLPHELDGALAAIAEAIVAPHYDDAAVTAAVEKRVGQLNDRRPALKGFQPAKRWVLGKRALTLSVDEMIAAAQRFDRRRALTAHTRMFAAQECAVVIVGPVDAAAVKVNVERHFGVWEPSTRDLVRRNRQLANVRPADVHYRHFEGSATLVAVAYPGPSRTADDYAATELMVALYGGMFASRLNQTVRERHAHSYFATAQYEAWERDGLIMAYTYVPPAELLEVVARLNGVTFTLRDTPATPGELATARAQVREPLRRGLETTPSLAAAAAGLFIHDLPADHWVTLDKAIAAVDAAAIQQAAERYLLRPSPTIVVGNVVAKNALVRSGLKVIYGPR